MTTVPAAPKVSLEVPSEGRAFVRIAMTGHVTDVAGEKAATAALKTIDELAGRPFGLLFDLRGVKRFDEPAAGRMQRLEMDAASKGLEIVAHLVSQPEMVKQLDEELKQLEASDLVGNFTDESQARAFVTGTRTVH